jgi:hypothetical protein
MRPPETPEIEFRAGAAERRPEFHVVRNS